MKFLIRAARWLTKHLPLSNFTRRNLWLKLPEGWRTK